MFENKVAIFAQPNSSDIGHFMQPFVVSFPDFANSFGVNLYGFDYSGYGRSGGTASEQNAYDDTESVFDEVVRREGKDIEILLIGFSIGTTAVVDLASKRPKNLFGIVLIAPFTSGIRLLKKNPRLEKTPWYDCFESYSKIPHVEVPVLVCHGTDDEMIPLSHGQVLHERAPHKIDPVVIAGGNHVNILQSRHVHLAIRMFIATKQFKRTSSALNAIANVNLEKNTAKEYKSVKEDYESVKTAKPATKEKSVIITKPSSEEESQTAKEKSVKAAEKESVKPAKEDKKYVKMK